MAAAHSPRIIPEALPDPFLRAAIRALVRTRRGTLRLRGNAIEAALLAEMATAPIALVPDAANRQHYEVPDELFRLMLGPRLKYSSCWWAPEVADLAGAEDAMLELTCARAGLADGMRILELGCGWGSLTLWMAQRYPGARITAVSNSASQREFIERACRDRGLGNVTVHTGNVAEVDPGGPFDRIVSVEMFEHMRNWSALLTRMAGWLAPGGEVFLHVFCHHRWAYPFRTDRPGAWMARTFFTGGLMPAFDLPRRIPSPFAVTRAWAVDGRHYARTADAWRRNLEANRDAALEVLAWHHGRLGAERAYHRWRVFHMACQELFGAGDGRVWHVGHYRLAPTGVAA